MGASTSPSSFPPPAFSLIVNIMTVAQESSLFFFYAFYRCFDIKYGRVGSNPAGPTNPKGDSEDKREPSIYTSVLQYI